MRLELCCCSRGEYLRGAKLIVLHFVAFAFAPFSTLSHTASQGHPWAPVQHGPPLPPNGTDIRRHRSSTAPASQPTFYLAHPTPMPPSPGILTHPHTHLPGPNGVRAPAMRPSTSHQHLAGQFMAPNPSPPNPHPPYPYHQQTHSFPMPVPTIPATGSFNLHRTMTAPAGHVPSPPPPSLPPKPSYPTFTRPPPASHSGTSPPLPPKVVYPQNSPTPLPSTTETPPPVPDVDENDEELTRALEMSAAESGKQDILASQEEADLALALQESMAIQQAQESFRRGWAPTHESPQLPQQELSQAEANALADVAYVAILPRSDPVPSNETQSVTEAPDRVHSPTGLSRIMEEEPLGRPAVDMQVAQAVERRPEPEPDPGEAQSAPPSYSDAASNVIAIPGRRLSPSLESSTNTTFSSSFLANTQSSRQTPSFESSPGSFHSSISTELSEQRNQNVASGSSQPPAPTHSYPMFSSSLLAHTPASRQTPSFETSPGSFHSSIPTVGTGESSEQRNQNVASGSSQPPAPTHSYPMFSSSLLANTPASRQTPSFEASPGSFHSSVPTISTGESSEQRNQNVASGSSQPPAPTHSYPADIKAPLLLTPDRLQPVPSSESGPQRPVTPVGVYANHFVEPQLLRGVCEF